MPDLSGRQTAADTSMAARSSLSASAGDPRPDGGGRLRRPSSAGSATVRPAPRCTPVDRLLLLNLHLGSDHHAEVQGKRRNANRRPSVLACLPAIQVHNEVREPIDDVGRLARARFALTIPCTISHAVTRSRSPKARLRLPSADSAVSRADAWASSNETSVGTLPKGPAGEPSGVSAPCPDTKARLPRTRTQLNETLIPGGSLAASGSTRPNSSSRCLIRTSATLRRLVRAVIRESRRPTNHVLCCRAAAAGGLPTRLVSPWTGLAHRPSCCHRCQV
jgi:hypothetical protein